MSIVGFFIVTFQQEANLIENTCETKTSTQETRPFSLSSDDSRTIMTDYNHVREFQANKCIYSISTNNSVDKAKKKAIHAQLLDVALGLEGH